MGEEARGSLYGEDVEGGLIAGGAPHEFLDLACRANPT